MLTGVVPGAGKFNMVNFCALSLASLVMSVPCLCSMTRLTMATSVELPMNARAMNEVCDETFHFADMTISGSSCTVRKGVVKVRSSVRLKSHVENACVCFRCKFNV